MPVKCTSTLNTLNMDKAKKPLCRVLRKALGQCKRLKKRVGKMLGKRKGSYEVNPCCPDPLQDPLSAETSTEYTTPTKRNAEYLTDAVPSICNANRENSPVAVCCTDIDGQQPKLASSQNMPGNTLESSLELKQMSAGSYQSDRVLRVDTKAELEPISKTPFTCGSSKTTRQEPKRPLKSMLFDRLDERAEKVSKLNFTSLEQVVNELINGCDTDVEKARVLFRWVVEKDYRHRRSANPPPRQSYHLLYQRLCRLSGLRCTIIQGYSKGAGYKPGMDIQVDSFRNCWTAVSVDDTWRLVNCTWAARHRTWNAPSSVDEFYFMTDPNEHIYQHLPDDPRWQLLDTPISKERFIELPLLKSNFFNSGLHLKKPHTSTIVTGEQNIEIRMTVPDHIDIDSCLQPCHPNMDGYGTQTSFRWEYNEAVFGIHSTHCGCFYLNIYAGKIGETLESACSFRIKSQKTPFFR